MATYDEIAEILQVRSPEASTLVDRFTVACVIAAEVIQDEAPTTPNHDNRVLWALEALSNSNKRPLEMLRFALARLKNLPVSQLLTRSDVQIQQFVESNVDRFAKGE